MIEGVSRVLIDVDDQDRAKDFWIDKLGFELGFDQTFAGERWVEVRPPSGSPMLVLVRRRDGEPRPQAPEGLPTSNVFFTCDDINETYSALTGRGVTFPVAPSEMHFGWWSVFQDEDDNRFALSVPTRDKPQG